MNHPFYFIKTLRLHVSIPFICADYPSMSPLRFPAYPRLSESLKVALPFLSCGVSRVRIRYSTHRLLPTPARASILNPNKHLPSWEHPVTELPLLASVLSAFHVFAERSFRCNYDAGIEPTQFDENSNPATNNRNRCFPFKTCRSSCFNPF